MSDLLSNKRIVIAGGGIGGLAFATSLIQQLIDAHEKNNNNDANASSTAAKTTAATDTATSSSSSSSSSSSFKLPSITIYEREPLETSVSREGYSLSIRSDTHGGGLHVINDLHLLDTLLPHCSTATYMTMFNAQLQPIIKVPNEKTKGLYNMRVSRNALKDTLLKGIERYPQHIKIVWNTQCINAKHNSDGNTITVTTATSRSSNDNNDKPKETIEVVCDLLIVADGSSSKLRSVLRPDDTLQFAGAVLIGGRTKPYEGKLPAPLDETWGVVMGAGDGNSCFIAPVGQHSALWGMSYLSKGRRQVKGGGKLSEDEAKKLLEEAHDRARYLSPTIHQLIDDTDVRTLGVLNANDKQPIQHSSEPYNVIFIGDASHAMSPFAGNGANMALKDAWELAQQLVKYGDNYKDAVTQYDKLSIPRSKFAIKFSHWSIDIGHSSGLRYYFYVAFFKALSWLMWLKGGKEISGQQFVELSSRDSHEHQS